MDSRSEFWVIWNFNGVDVVISKHKNRKSARKAVLNVPGCACARVKKVSVVK